MSFLQRCEAVLSCSVNSCPQYAGMGQFRVVLYISFIYSLYQKAEKCAGYWFFRIIIDLFVETTVGLAGTILHACVLKNFLETLYLNSKPLHFCCK